MAYDGSMAPMAKPSPTHTAPTSKRSPACGDVRHTRISSEPIALTQMHAGHRIIRSQPSQDSPQQKNRPEGSQRP